MKKILLDTNAYSNYLKGDQAVFKEIVSSDRVYLSVFVIAELLTGFKGGNRQKENRAILDKFLSKSTVSFLKAGVETSEIFSEYKYQLKNQGTPIPINDVWIAAHVRESGATLITYDNHFKHISNLKIWSNVK
ncbi:type II toxin-antitoxin system VapC family toxin [Reichenbachiella sp. MALMAid0571]|uniref:type II toxin-antitoxin system VapC family toxin n=1 Tax=Reichenbachiella sp. MALMAid0571 TaxID=3143939 RepID=UPI0032DE7A77